ncbi:Bug family tripartite tricarboxylate transporter substrate binding protein [Frigidibacter oleivorans]|uniref:Bug family tripartite tricarboxylate transporter substrate binding protein n=1 Tax=Frigidibacter oleivorans TaxID=2487129 RepID=UPI000F8D0A2D|nr:tripartite tricarboxylate transporter substrate binding protein [Frigidibacter oleivorans]
MMTSKRTLLQALAAAAALAAVGGVANAQDYPSRPITLIVPQSPGGGTDLVARAIQTGVESAGASPQPIVVINREGAGGSAGTREVLNADPDGYTIGIWHSGLVFGKAMGVVDYDHTAFTLIGQVAETAMGIGVSSTSDIMTLPDLIERARSGTVSFATNFGASPQIVPLLLSNEAGAPFRFVQTQGGDGARMTQVVGGHTDAALLSAGGLVRFAEQGVRPLAVFSSEREPVLPDVPTAAESGYDTLFSERLVLIAPPDTPAEVVETLVGYVNTALAQPAAAEQLASLGFNVRFLDGATVSGIFDDLSTDIEAVADQLN